MSWATPNHSKGEVDRAGRTLVRPDAPYAEFADSLAIINNWRSSHSFPLNTFQVGLRRKARAIDDEALIAQRIKRLSSIEAKLVRFPKMNLSQMQDIGGCRAVVKSVSQVRQLAEAHRQSAVKHKLLRVDDYLSVPQASGTEECI